MYNTLTNTNCRKRDPHYEGNTNFDISTATVATAKAENMEGLFHHGSFS